MRGKFNFLGTGASSGVPVIGCKCGVCLSASLFNKRLRVSGLIRTLERAILIDVGPDFRQQALRAGIDRLDGVLLTHTHYDHIAGIDELRTYYLYSQKALPLLLSEESFEELKRRYYYILQPTAEGASLAAQLDARILPGERGEVDFLGVLIRYFSYHQGLMKVTGYRIGDFAYVSDIREYDEGIFDWLSGVRVLALSALRDGPARLMFSLDEAVQFARRAGAAKTWLIHMNHEVDYNAVKLPSGIQLAHDGLEVEFEI